MTGRRQTRGSTALPCALLFASVLVSAAPLTAAEPPGPADPGLDAVVWRSLYTRVDSESVDSPLVVSRDDELSVTIQFDQLSRDGRSIAFEDLEWRESSGTMRAARARVSQEGGRIRLFDVTWQLGSASDRRSLMAERVTYGPGADGSPTWRFQRLRARESIGFPLSQGPSPEGLPSGGVLPPTVRFRPGAEFELQLAALHGRLGAGPLIEVAPGLWYGLGAVIRSRPTSLEEPMMPGGLLEADLRWRDTVDAPGWRITGTAHRGTGLRHGSVDLEAVSQSEFWHWEALDATAFGRQWRLSRFGASLSGPEWSLQIDAALFEHAGPSTLSMGLRYGSQHELTPWLKAQFRLAHRSRVPEQSAPLDAAHATALFGGLQAEAGRPGRVNAVAGVGLRATQRISPTQSPSTGDRNIGFSTRPSAQVIANAHVKATLEGRFPDTDFVHRIIPSVGAVAAPIGAGPSEVAPTRRLSPWVASRREEWTAGAVTLEQQFEFSDATLSVPAGLWLNDTGWDDGIDGWGAFGRAHLQSPHLDLQGAVIHRAAGGLGWDAQAVLKVGDHPRVRLRYGPTSATRETAILARTDRLVRDPASAARLLQGTHSESYGTSPAAFGDDRIHHRAGLRLAWTPIVATIDGLVDGRAESWGGAVGLEYPIETLGLAVTLRSVFRNAPETWGLSLGFQPD